MKIVPIIPSFNPNESLIKVVNDLILNNFTKIIIVNDGSQDDAIFNKIALKKECIVLTHDLNKGKGAALKTAFAYYKDNLLKEYKGVVTLDDDLQHKISDVLKISQIVNDNNMFVLGTRLFNANNVPKRNKFGNNLTTKLFKKFYGIYLKDTQTGLRGIPNHLIDLHLLTQGDRYEYELNALIDLVKSYEKIIQVDIETVYLDNSNKNSHFKVIEDSYKIYKILFKRRKK